MNGRRKFLKNPDLVRRGTNSILENQDSEGGKASRVDMPADWQSNITFVALVVDGIRR